MSSRARTAEKMPRIPDADWPSSDFLERHTARTSAIPRSGLSRASTAALADG